MPMYAKAERSALESSLLRELGPVLGGAALARALGYRTQAAFRTAALRGQVPVPLFYLAGRRGRFALTRDVAYWLADARSAAGRISED